MAVDCIHLERLADVGVDAASSVCDSCVAMGATWVHLRRCQTCGHVGCCDQSPNRHATGHFHATEHPVVRSHEPGETWAWCYVDRTEYDPAYDDAIEGADLS